VTRQSTKGCNRVGITTEGGALLVSDMEIS